MRISFILAITVLQLLLAGCSGENSGTVSSHDLQNNSGETQPSPASTPDTKQFEDPKSAATNALSNLKQLLVEGQNFREMGFENLEQVDRASLGDPASVYVVGLDQLRDYGPTHDPKSLLVDAKRMVFPVVADGTGRTLVTIEQRDGKWRFVSFSDQRVARNLVRVREEKSSGPEGLSSSQYFLVQIKAMFLTFLGNQQPGSSATNSLRLVPLNGKTELIVSPAFRDNHAFLIENPQFNAEEAGAMKAKDVFAALSTSAKSLDSSKPF